MKSIRKCLCVSVLCVLYACSRTTTLVPDSVVLYAGDSIQVTVKDEVVAAGYFTTSEFVASVNAKTGWVVARHVGSTQVVYGRDKGDYGLYYGCCTVEVRPRYSYYVEPLEGFPTPQEVKDSLGQPDSLIHDSLYYAYVYGDAGNAWAPKDDYETRYVFDIYDMFQYAVVVGWFAETGLSLAQVRDFLAERYEGGDGEYWYRYDCYVRVSDLREVDGPLRIRYTPVCNLPD